MERERERERDLNQSSSKMDGPRRGSKKRRKGAGRRRGVEQRWRR